MLHLNLFIMSAPEGSHSLTLQDTYGDEWCEPFIMYLELMTHIKTKNVPFTYNVELMTHCWTPPVPPLQQSIHPTHSFVFCVCGGLLMFNHVENFLDAKTFWMQNKKVLYLVEDQTHTAEEHFTGHNPIKNISLTHWLHAFWLAKQIEHQSECLKLALFNFMHKVFLHTSN